MKKITILCLHLDYGGVEVATTNLANMLSNNYDVEIISFYNLNGKPAYKLSDNIKVKYIYDGKPNREEIKDSIRKFKIFTLIKESIKSIKILYKKKYNIIGEIKKCKSDLIISTRIEFTELLNKYYKGNAVLISQEHRHHNNDKRYIKRVQNSLTNIDYYMPVSKKMTKFYKNKVKTKVMYGPLCVDYIPDKETKKTSKNIISIGRLSPEKGYLDLIDVFKIIHQKDNECILHIIGDGIERKLIKDKIKELKLNNFVKVYGYKDKSFIREKLNEMSLYLMTSYEESFGLVLLEASAYGIPSIAFDCAEGATEIINNDVDGYLIENRNKEKMAEKALELLENRNKLANFGHNARTKCLEYSYENVKEKWLSIIDKMI